MKPSLVKDKSYAFALRTIALAKRLKAQKEFEIAGQVLRSGTAIGSNVEVALAGVSAPISSPKCLSLPRKLVKHITGCGCCAIPRLFPNPKFHRWQTRAWNWFEC